MSLNFIQAMSLLKNGSKLYCKNNVWTNKYGYIYMDKDGHILDKNNKDYDGSMTNSWETLNIEETKANINNIQKLVDLMLNTDRELHRSLNMLSTDEFVKEEDRTTINEIITKLNIPDFFEYISEFIKDLKLNDDNF